jgi:acetyl-CoA carboxylase biotin carboxyl carrier protein
MSGEIELLLEESSGRVRLLSPEVGFFTEALSHGAEVAPGDRAGSLLSLGRAFELRVPAGAAGVITSAPPDRVRAPVGCGDVLYELAPASAAKSKGPRGDTSEATRGGALVLRSPQAGRFYHRPSPSDPTFVAVGATIEDGQPVGMIEVMKTFSHVPYRAGGGLPKRAKVARMLAADGADVKPGEPLLEVEPA